MANKKKTIDELLVKLAHEIAETTKWYNTYLDVCDTPFAERVYKNWRNWKARRDRTKNKLTALQRAAHLQQAPDGAACDTVEDTVEAGQLAEDLAPEAPEPPFRR